MGNLPLEVVPGQRKTHVNSYRRQTVHRGKVDLGVSELSQGNELSWGHINRPLIPPYWCHFPGDTRVSLETIGQLDVQFNTLRNSPNIYIDPVWTELFPNSHGLSFLLLGVVVMESGGGGITWKYFHQKGLHSNSAGYNCECKMSTARSLSSIVFDVMCGTVQMIVNKNQ